MHSSSATEQAGVIETLAFVTALIPAVQARRSSSGPQFTGELGGSIRMIYQHSS